MGYKIVSAGKDRYKIVRDSDFWEDMAIVLIIGYCIFSIISLVIHTLFYLGCGLLIAAAVIGMAYLVFQLCRQLWNYFCHHESIIPPQTLHQLEQKVESYRNSLNYGKIVQHCHKS